MSADPGLTRRKNARGDDSDAEGEIQSGQESVSVLIGETETEMTVERKSNFGWLKSWMQWVYTKWNIELLHKKIVDTTGAYKPSIRTAAFGLFVMLLAQNFIPIFFEYLFPDSVFLRVISEGSVLGGAFLLTLISAFKDKGVRIEETGDERVLMPDKQTAKKVCSKAKTEYPMCLA